MTRGALGYLGPTFNPRSSACTPTMPRANLGAHTDRHGRPDARDTLGRRAGPGAEVAVQSIVGAGWSVRQHRRLARGTQPRPDDDHGARPGAANACPRGAGRSARRRRAHGDRLGAPIATPQPRGRPGAARRDPRRGPCAPPPRRRPTRPRRGAVERRLAAKRRRAETKRLRRSEED
jgi:hypothetical protein